MDEEFVLTLVVCWRSMEGSDFVYGVLIGALVQVWESHGDDGGIIAHL